MKPDIVFVDTSIQIERILGRKRRKVEVEQHLANESILIENPQNSLGQFSCSPLGDIIIGLQVPVECQLWTTDRDFGIIAEALGIELYQL